MRAILAAAGIAILAGGSMAAWDRRYQRPCPAHHIAIIGDSNVANMDLGPGCANLGVGGNTSKQMADRFTARDVAALAPILVIWATDNDVHFETGYGARYLGEMARASRAGGQRVILTTPIPLIDKSLLPPRGHKTQLQVDRAVNALADQVRSLGKTEGFSVADVHAALLNKDGSLNRDLYIAQDGTYEHLNRAGISVALRTILAVAPK